LAPIALNLDQKDRRRARDIGIPFEGTTGRFNAVTDVPGVEVGFTTLISGSTKEVAPVIHTGVTAVLPRGKRESFFDYVFAAWFSLNGYGEMTGSHAIEETGFMQGPLMITNTCSVGVVRDAVDEWAASHGSHMHLSTVAETSDIYLNDMEGFHVRKEHAFSAIESASAGKVAEGNVGGGAGMICYGFKGGTGTSSRVVELESGDSYTVGVLVQTNHGDSRDLMVAGIPVGLELPRGLDFARRGSSTHGEKEPLEGKNSIIILVATDAPLLPHQLKRVARRASLGLARTGSFSSDRSGDIFLALSTANSGAQVKNDLRALPNHQLDPLFRATVQATEESIINSLIAAETMEGVRGRVNALPQDLLIEILRKHNRLH